LQALLQIQRKGMSSGFVTQSEQDFTAQDRRIGLFLAFVMAADEQQPGLCYLGRTALVI
jgi:hypothetical protein